MKGDCNEKMKPRPVDPHPGVLYSVKVEHGYLYLEMWRMDAMNTVNKVRDKGDVLNLVSSNFKGEEWGVLTSRMPSVDAVRIVRELSFSMSAPISNS